MVCVVSLDWNTGMEQTTGDLFDFYTCVRVYIWYYISRLDYWTDTFFFVKYPNPHTKLQYYSYTLFTQPVWQLPTAQLCWFMASVHKTTYFSELTLFNKFKNFTKVWIYT